MKRKWFTPKGLASRTSALASAFAATLLILGTAGAAAAQDGAVAGQVTSETGETLVGVQVFIPGTSFGTLTDEAGRYRLTGVPAGEHTLRVSIIGYRGSDQLVTVSAGEVATFDFVLPVSAVALDEVVATITGDRLRRELATDIAIIDAGVVTDNTRAKDITSVLKGQATGVFVRRSDGTVGTGSKVKIRGTGSIGLTTAPLYVIDGAIIDGESQALDPFLLPQGAYAGGQESTRLNDLNPDEIESIEVIKGPAASALWGARANAGVIIITTKKGSAETRWQVRADLGFNRDLTDYRPIAFNPAIFGLPSDTVYLMNLFEQDSQSGKVPLRDGLYQNYNGNVSGGAGDWNYFGSVQYLNEKGTLPSNAQERFNFRANFEANPSSKFNLSLSNGYSSSNLTLPQNDNNIFGFFGQALLGLPENLIQPLPNDPVTGEPIPEEFSCPLNFEAALAFNAPASVFGPCGGTTFIQADFDQISNLFLGQKVERYTGSGNVVWTPVTQWINRFTLGYDMFSSRILEVFPVDPTLPGSFGASALGTVGKPNYTSRNLTLQGTTTLLVPISSSWGFDATGGVQWFRQTQEATNSQGQIFPAGRPAVNNSVTNQAEDAFVETKSIGFFVQGQFDWDSRLFFNGAVRWDNNSSAGLNLGVQAYPKAGASFVVAEGGGFVNMLKIRGAWGRSGRLPGTNAAKALLTTQQTSLAGADVLGITPLRPGNPDLAPEVGEEWEAGFDAAFWEDRIGLTFTYYDQRTKNTVVAKDLAPSSGFPNEINVNIGQIENSGLEVALDALVLNTNNFTWNWRFIVSHNDNLITELVDPIVFNFGDQRLQQGLPFAAYVAPKLEFGEDGEPRIIPCSETPGTWGPDDESGDRQDFCNPADDHRYIGDPNPRTEGSVQTTLNLFKYFQLYALFDFQAGQRLYNVTLDFQCAFAVCPERFEKGADGELTDEAKLFGFAASRGVEEPFIPNATWGKLRTAQLRFDLPDSWVRFLKLRGMSLQFIGENLVTWSDYSGYDPEFNFVGQGEGNSGDFLTYPPPRRFIGTININF